MSKLNNKSIVLATGIFYPDVGGPAVHVKKIAEMLVQNGWNVTVITYSDFKGRDNHPFKVERISRSLPLPLRMARYFLVVLKHALRARIVYIFNLSSAGLPAFWCAKILGKKTVIRIGGDPMWERTVENNKRFISILEYYQAGYHRQDNPRLFRAMRHMLNNTDVLVMYSDFWKDFYEKYYGVSPKSVKIIYNPVFRKATSGVKSDNEEFTFIFAGRFVSYKNLELVLRVFDKISRDKEGVHLKLIGKGPDREKLVKIINELPSRNKINVLSSMPQEELFTHIKNASVCLGPALTEFNPNFILECLSFGVPAVLSRENGLTIKLPDEWLFEAKNENELEKIMSSFLDKDFYNNAKKNLGDIMIEQTWEKVLANHLEILNNL